MVSKVCATVYVLTLAVIFLATAFYLFVVDYNLKAKFRELTDLDDEMTTTIAPLNEEVSTNSQQDNDIELTLSQNASQSTILELLTKYSQKVNTVWSEQLLDCSFFLSKELCASNQTELNQMETSFAELADLKHNLTTFVNSPESMNSFEVIPFLYKARDFVQKPQSAKFNFCESDDQQCRDCVAQKVDCLSINPSHLQNFKTSLNSLYFGPLGCKYWLVSYCTTSPLKPEIDQQKESYDQLIGRFDAWIAANVTLADRRVGEAMQEAGEMIRYHQMTQVDLCPSGDVECKQCLEHNVDCFINSPNKWPCKGPAEWKLIKYKPVISDESSNDVPDSNCTEIVL